MTTKDEYKKRSMAELADAALEIIQAQPGMRCGLIGDRLFRGKAYMKGSAPYARLAGKVMKVLQEEGRAYYGSNSGWYPMKPRRPDPKRDLWHGKSCVVPSDIAVCPECGDTLYAECVEWNEETGRPSGGEGIDIDCGRDVDGEDEIDDDLVFDHKWHQSDWQDVVDAVREWAMGETNRATDHAVHRVLVEWGMPEINAKTGEPMNGDDKARWLKKRLHKMHNSAAACRSAIVDALVFLTGISEEHSKPDDNSELIAGLMEVRSDLLEASRKCKP